MDCDAVDDSIDDFLANIEIPSAPKVQKVEKPQTLILSNASNTNTSAASANSTATAPLPKTASNPHCILVNPKQRGNPVLKSIVNIPIEFRDDIIPDYVVGRTSCILFISLKYHTLNPDYICQRLKELGKQYELRVLLVQIDAPEPHSALKNLTRITLLTDLTLMLAWSAEEAGKIIETYKQFEKRSPEWIMERVESSPHQKLVSALTSIKPVNKTDAVTLLQNFGKLEKLINASEERLSLVIGLGPRKASKLYKTLHEPFLTK
ncbi:PREDICTED: DNA excision repair protein ERCC-1 [Rhagoletis zephyria]|uniref:DNA excision repair protein ERCC-1 n=1 Tax=Rhagoletis zephyria TaxID=28612 RepID=UPI0008116058|nr:PREDICTED: DNA excision repair protein ERCC-1 [Rhagoletis zephyria]XP_017470436.1 PREDICTED: DNA excision repair protein ERCC-1 [Rhagoletis zephyria]